MAADDPTSVDDALERFGPYKSSKTELNGEVFIRWIRPAPGPPGSAEDIRLYADGYGRITRFQRRAVQLSPTYDFDNDRRRQERRDERTRRI